MPAPKTTVITPQMVKNVGCLVKMVFGFIILLIMGYFALVALNPKARQWATSKKGPTPFKAVNQILAIPAQTIGKTNDVVAANNANVKLLDGVIADEEGKKKKGGATGGPVADPFASATEAAKKALGGAGSDGAAAGKAKTGDGTDKGVSADALIAMQEKLANLPDGPAAAAPVKDTAQVVQEAANPYSFAKPEEKKDAAPVAPPPEVKLPGGIVVASASPAGAPPATPQFLYWVVNLNISGVFQSNPHRVLLNNRTITEGQEVNAALGIVFDHLDLDQKLIVFRDKTGALVTRSY